MFNDFFSHVAMDIGFKDDIPDDLRRLMALPKLLISILIIQVL